MDEQRANIKGMGVIFKVSISINTITSAKPTPFTINYFRTLTEMAGKRFSSQMGEAMVERASEDLNSIPPEKLWVSE